VSAITTLHPAFLCTVLSTSTLAVLLAAHPVPGAAKGAEMGLLVAVGRPTR
jgi:hypothetical protein